MKFTHPILLVIPLATYAFQLPFDLPNIELPKFDIKKLEDFKKNLPDLPTYESVKSRLQEIPAYESVKSRISESPVYDKVKSRVHALQAQIPLPDFVNEFIDSTSSSSSTSRLLKLHKELVEIHSVTDTEHKVVKFLADYLKLKNFTVELIPVPAGSSDTKRHNVFAYPHGTDGQTRLLVTSHVDTVPPFIPYKRTAKTIYGRGTCDAKASVAAQIIAVEDLLASKYFKKNDISLLYVVGEETTGDGMRTINAINNINKNWEAVIFGEPTEGKLAIGHKGLAMVDIYSHGKAAHSGYPDLGVSANSNLVKALYKLDGLTLPSSHLLGKTTVNIGKMSGGVAANVVPAEAMASVSIRIAADTVALLQQLVGDALDGMEGIELKWKWPMYNPIILSSNVEGFDTITVNYGTDIPNLNGGHRKYLYGPGSILVAHGDNEQIDISDFASSVKGYKRLIKQILNPSSRSNTQPHKQDTDSEVVPAIPSHEIENTPEPIIPVSFEHATEAEVMPQEEMVPGFEDEATQSVTSTRTRAFAEMETAVDEKMDRDSRKIEVDPVEQIIQEAYEEELRE